MEQINDSVENTDILSCPSFYNNSNTIFCNLSQPYLKISTYRTFIPTFYYSFFIFYLLHTCHKILIIFKFLKIFSPFFYYVNTVYISSIKYLFRWANLLQIFGYIFSIPSHSLCAFYFIFLIYFPICFYLTD